MFWLYTQQATCDAHADGCLVNVSVHPEDRLFSETSPDSNIVVVGIDDASVNALQAFPVPRSAYASALRNLESAGAAVVAFDVSMPDPRDAKSDADFASAMRDATVPVVLAYSGEDTIAGAGFIEQTSSSTKPLGVDQMPLKQFWCADANTERTVSCATPYKNVILASTDVAGDADGVIRRMPMFVQPACYATAACPFDTLNPLGFAAYRAFALGADFATGPSLQESGAHATFGTTWTNPLQVDSTGAALINYAVAAGGFKRHQRYLAFSDVANGTFSGDAVKGKIVLVGAYYLTGFHDEFSTPAAGGTSMPGVEVHANVLQMLLPATPRFLTPESPVVLLLIMLVLSVATAVGVARVSVLWGFAGTVGALVLFTVGMAALAVFNGWVPDLFHPWLAIALTYTGVTAYRFLYEDRE